MFNRLNLKMVELASGSHSECGAFQLTNHFIKTHSVADDITISSLIAAIPCTRELAQRAKAKWKQFRAL